MHPVGFADPFDRTLPPPQIVAVIPARYNATRLPGKPLIDIEKEAARLQVRPPQEPHYTEPSRNPFRFSERREPARATTGVAAPSPPVPIAPLPPPPPRITLDGVAADVVGGENKRTAVLNTDAGIVLAKEGDQVAGYRVEKIAADAVELVKIEDGSVLRLGLR